MMKDRRINTENYELFLVDYLEGTLAAELKEELLLFLDEHPEIKEEAEGYFDLVLKPDSSKVNGLSLKKNEDQLPPMPFDTADSDMLFAAALEGDLNEGEKEALRVLTLSDIKFQKDKALFSNTILKADENLKFGEREKLYRLDIQRGNPLNNENFDEYCVAYHEGDLDENESKKVAAFARKDKKLAGDLELFGKIKMQADQDLLYKDKAALKKAPVVIFSRTSALRIAASVAAVFIFIMLLPGLLNRNSTLNYDKPVRIDVAAKVPVKKGLTKKEEAAEPPAQPSIAVAHIKTVKARKHLMIAKAEPKMPRAKILLPAMNADSYKAMTFAFERPLDGYYEVKLEKENFIKTNPKLVKKVVAGVRKLLRISPQDLKVPDDKLTLWDVADAGLKGIGAMTENNFSLSRK